MLGDLDRTDFLIPHMLLSVEDLDRQRLLDDEYGRLAQIAARIAGHRATLKSQQEKLVRASRQARRSTVSASSLYGEAEKVAEVEARVAGELRPLLDQLAGIAAQMAEAGSDDKINRAIRRYAEETIDIGVSWLELIQNHRLELLRWASEKGGDRPIISSADELDRELARLAEDEG
jgi:seryl-tRNA synthetase